MNFDANAPDDEERPLITAPCMRALVKMAGVSFKQRKGMRKLENKVSIRFNNLTNILQTNSDFQDRQKRKSAWSKATTTDLVHDVFESFFAEQIDKSGKKIDDKGPRKKRCGICEACQSPDCGKCSYCRDMLKFGGSGRSKQACQTRRCPNLAILEAEESEGEDEEEGNVKVAEAKEAAPASKRIIHEVSSL